MHYTSYQLVYVYIWVQVILSLCVCVCMYMGLSLNLDLRLTHLLNKQVFLQVKPKLFINSLIYWQLFFATFSCNNNLEDLKYIYKNNLPNLKERTNSINNSFYEHLQSLGIHQLWCNVVSFIPYRPVQPIFSVLVPGTIQKRPHFVPLWIPAVPEAFRLYRPKYRISTWKWIPARNRNTNFFVIFHSPKIVSQQISRSDASFSYLGLFSA